METILSVRDLVVRRGDAPLNFDVTDGLTLLITERESGASTLNMALAGRYRPKGGEIVLDGKPTSPRQRFKRVVMGSWIPAVLVGLVQAFNLWVVQDFVLKVDPVHPFQMLMALGFIAAVFNTAILAIYALFGPSVGRLITMVLMSLQLVASNGLYPPEVQPKFIQWVHSWDPMRYSVDLMRHTLFGTLPGDNRVHIAMTVLGAVGVVAFLLAMLGFWKERVLMEKDIHPELNV